MAVMRLQMQACAGMGGAKCGGHVTCAAPARLVPQVAHAYWAIGRHVLGLLEDRLVALPAGYMQARRECIDQIMTAAAPDACCHPTSWWRSLRWLQPTPQAPLGLLRRALSCL